MNINKRISLAFIQIISILFLVACGGGSSNEFTETENPPVDETTRGALISSTFLGNNTVLFRPYTIDSYKIIYSTVDTDNNQINASGLLSIPKKASGAKSPLVSYQHGTIFTDARAPSNDISSIEGIGILAGAGYIVSSPDYLGYAESTSIIHPYVHADSLASASIDMLRASKTFLANQNIEINEQLFLAGYSEGGYATIALQRELQNNFSSEFTTTASAAGAGPYSLLESAKFFANLPTNDNPSYMSFVVKAYDTIYSLDKIDEMYQQQYRNIINTSFDGSKSGSEIDALLTTTTADLFEPNFLAILQGSESHPIKDALALNNVFDWKPNAPTRLYHGVQDEIVPYSNSVKALEAMEANGATDVSLRTCPLNGHVACAVPYVLDALTFLNTYANDL